MARRRARPLRAMERKDSIMTIGSYVTYIVISLAITVWVAQTLYRNGRVFLIDAFHGNEELADSVNHLLVVGFYLINVGYISLMLRMGVKPANLVEAIEKTSHKLGGVLMIIGLMHFINIRVFSSMRRRARANHRPPVAPSEQIAVPAGA
jgi:hypothetical protein